MLIVYKNSLVFEVIGDHDSFYEVRRPYSTSSPLLWVEKTDCTEYPHTNESILKKWIPDYDHTQIWNVERYLLETLSAILVPEFLLAPKEEGYYTAIWIDENNVLQITNILYCEQHWSLSDSDHLEGYNIFLIEKMYWVELKFYISHSGFRYLRFIPTQKGWTYVYLLHLLESGNFTPAEIDAIWRG